MEIMQNLPASILEVDRILAEQLELLRKSVELGIKDNNDNQIPIPKVVLIKSIQEANTQHDNSLGGFYQHTHRY